MHGLVHAIHLLVVPYPARLAEHFIYHPKAISKLGCLPDGIFNLAVILLFFIIEVRPMDIQQFARPRDAYVVFSSDFGCQLFLNLGL